MFHKAFNVEAYSFGNKPLDLRPGFSYGNTAGQIGNVRAVARRVRARKQLHTSSFLESSLLQNSRQRTFGNIFRQMTCNGDRPQLGSLGMSILTVTASDSIQLPAVIL